MISFKCLNNPFDTLLNLCFKKAPLREELLFGKWRDQGKMASVPGRKFVWECSVNYFTIKMLDNFWCSAAWISTPLNNTMLQFSLLSYFVNIYEEKDLPGGNMGLAPLHGLFLPMACSPQPSGCTFTFLTSNHTLKKELKIEDSSNVKADRAGCTVLHFFKDNKCRTRN